MVRQRFFRRLDENKAKVGDFSFIQEPNGYYRIKEYVALHNGILLTIIWPDYLLNTIDECKHKVEEVIHTILKEQGA